MGYRLLSCRPCLVLRLVHLFLYLMSCLNVDLGTGRSPSVSGLHCCSLGGLLGAGSCSFCKVGLVLSHQFVRCGEGQLGSSDGIVCSVASGRGRSSTLRRHLLSRLRTLGRRRRGNWVGCATREALCVDEKRRRQLRKLGRDGGRLARLMRQRSSRRPAEDGCELLRTLLVRLAARLLAKGRLALFGSPTGGAGGGKTFPNLRELIGRFAEGFHALCLCLGRGHARFLKLLGRCDTSLVGEHFIFGREPSRSPESNDARAITTRAR
mmetsp:Transcript_5175/g.11392  ORF Transcript_5175/g.11392 Transcript_5175/m.11392 type:complete len:266 (+) Transcript_5175:188-985(+)